MFHMTASMATVTSPIGGFLFSIMGNGVPFFKNNNNGKKIEIPLTIGFYRNTHHHLNPELLACLETSYTLITTTQFIHGGKWMGFFRNPTVALYATVTLSKSDWTSLIGFTSKPIKAGATEPKSDEFLPCLLVFLIIFWLIITAPDQICSNYFKDRDSTHKKKPQWRTDKFCKPNGSHIIWAALSEL